MWSPEVQIVSMQPAVAKLRIQLEKEGICMLPNTGDVKCSRLVTKNNVGFYRRDDPLNIMTISHHSFYRFSGISCITRDKPGSNNESETIPVSDDTYMNTFMRPIIEVALGVKEIPVLS
jgi:hypothetical protein